MLSLLSLGWLPVDFISWEMAAYYIYLVNCRRVADRPRDPANWNEIADVVAALSIPVIANGDVFEYEDFQRIKDATGYTST